MSSPVRLGRLDRSLRLFADVRAGEGALTLLLAANLFLILTAYYVLKPVREALILGEGSPELKAYMSAGQVAVLAAVVPAYGRLVTHWSRRRLINVVTGIFIGCLLLFYVLGHARVSIGIAFFIWIGVFNLMIVAQFWAFANDLYTKEAGERLFPVIGFGAALGGVLGSYVAARLIRPFGVYDLMLIGAVLLRAQLQVTNYVERRTDPPAPAVPDRQPSSGAAAAAGEPHQNAFAMVWRTRYLRYMALMVLLLATVDATGEYVLGSIVKDAAVRYVADGRAPGLDVAQVIAVFYSRYFGLVNVLSLVLQLFFVSRIIRHFGIPVAVAMLPALSCIAYTVLAFVPSLWFVLGAKVAEKGSNYSLSATVQNILYLSCTRAEKYSAKQTIDAFCYRLGDVVSAALVFVGGAVGLRASGFAKANILLAVLWLAVSVVVGRRYVRRQTSTLPPPEVAGHRASRLDATPGR